MSGNNNTIHFCNEIGKSKSRKESSLHLCDRSLSEPKECPTRKGKNGRRRSKSNSKVTKMLDKLKNGYQKAKLNLSVLNSSIASSKRVPSDLNSCCKSKDAANFKDYLIFGRTTLHDSSKNDRLDSFSFGNIIGKGSYGVVYNALSKNGTKYAIKLVLYEKLKQNIRYNSKKCKAKDVFLNDLKRFIDLKHPNVLRLFSVFDSSNDDKIYLIFELAMRPLMVIPSSTTYTEVETLFYFRDIINGLKYLRENGIPHLDLKPSNLLLSFDHRVKVADFGLSIAFDENFFSFYTVTGSIGFCAPELLSKNSSDFDLRSLFISDIWSLGIVLYCLIFGNLPWTHKNVMEVIDNILNSIPIFPSKPSINAALYDLIGRMICKDPEYRITLAEIEDHCWVNVGECINSTKEQLGIVYYENVHHACS